jgi:CO/xanthine dehydrogenase FAD-binding subunit
VLHAGDIVTSIQFPLPPTNLQGKYIKLGRNQASDLAIIGVTVVAYRDHGSASGFRIRLALASVAPVPLVVDQVEAILSSQPITEQTLYQAAQASMDACNPIDDVRASAKYRRLMVRNLSLKALREVWETIRH